MIVPTHETEPREPLDHEAGTRERVLELVVELGPVSAATLAKDLDLTPAAVRRHITHLLEHERIVEHEPSGTGPRGRGRPARHYVATDAGRAVLRDAYSDLATQALAYLGEVAGPGALEDFAAGRVHELERRYTPLVEAAGSDPTERVRALATALTADGYAATTRAVGAHGTALQLCQGHCPVQEVAEAFPQLCEAETQAFSRLLGIHVQRLSTLSRGDHVCTTHVPVTLTRPGPLPGAAADRSSTTTPLERGVTEGNR